MRAKAHTRTAGWTACFAVPSDVKAYASVARTIEVAHENPVWFTCGDALHGHSVDVAVEVEYDPATTAFYEHPPQEALDRHLSELDGRNLNDMIRPARPNHYGLANWIFDRMNRDYPVNSVTVSTGDCEVKLWADEEVRWRR